MKPDGVLQLQLSSRAASAAAQSVAALIAARIEQAQAQAECTCQRCGRGDARQTGQGWLVTLCAPCEQQGALHDLDGHAARTTATPVRGAAPPDSGLQGGAT